MSRCNRYLPSKQCENNRKSDQASVAAAQQLSWHAWVWFNMQTVDNPPHTHTNTHQPPPTSFSKNPDSPIFHFIVHCCIKQCAHELSGEPGPAGQHRAMRSCAAHLSRALTAVQRQFPGSSRNFGLNLWLSQTWPAQRAGICGDLFPEWGESLSPTSSQTKSMSSRETAALKATDTRNLFQIKVLHAEVLMAHSTCGRPGNTQQKQPEAQQLKGC